MSGVAIILLCIAWALLGVAVVLLHRNSERRIARLEHEVRALRRRR